MVYTKIIQRFKGQYPGCKQRDKRVFLLSIKRFDVF